MGEKKSFVLFNDLGIPVKSLPDEEAGKLFKAIFEYQNGGIEQELSASAEMAFIFVKQQLDRNQEKYEETCNKNRENAFKRWDKQKANNATASDRIRPPAKHADIDPDNDIDNEIEDKNEPFLYLAELLYELHKKEDVKYQKPKSHLYTWANDIRLLNNDGRSKEEIESVIRWCQEAGCFWFPNIISGKKLRAKFDTMLFQMKRDKKDNATEKKLSPEAVKLMKMAFDRSR